MTIELKEPFPEWAWPNVYQWAQTFKNRVFDDLSPNSVGEFVEHQREKARSPLYRSWGVSRDGELGGVVVFEQGRPADIWGVTHAVFRKSFFGHQTTIPALQQVYAQLFNEGISVIRSEVYVDNCSIRMLARKLGFQEYGPIPNAVLRNGRPTGLIGLFLTKEDFENANRLVASTDHGGGFDGSSGPVEPGQESDHQDRTDPDTEQHRTTIEPTSTGGFEQALHSDQRPTPGQPVPYRHQSGRPGRKAED